MKIIYNIKEDVIDRHIKSKIHNNNGSLYFVNIMGSKDIRKVWIYFMVKRLINKMRIINIISQIINYEL